MPAALILIDIQTGFGHPAWGPRTTPDAEDTAGARLTAWRAACDILQGHA